MADYYFDTSALVKYYVKETGAQWVRGLIQTRRNGRWANVISTSALTWAEAVSAFSRLHRSKVMPDDLYERLIEAFLADGRTRYSRLPVDNATISQATGLIQRHPLRAYDAVQLATALRLDRVLRDNRRPPVTFVSADGALCDVAEAEGLAAVNPNAMGTG
jgi:hypothetical protein